MVTAVSAFKNSYLLAAAGRSVTQLKIDASTRA
jgi:hypothetical protein